MSYSTPNTDFGEEHDLDKEQEEQEEESEEHTSEEESEEHTPDEESEGCTSEEELLVVQAAATAAISTALALIDYSQSF